ncbi:MAG TPA: hypothetical protein VGJ00_05615 [Rhabdochlamydiaceae bacterium]|jgi:hypothetical protein
MKIFLSFFLVLSGLNANPCINRVTYRLSKGRFGDDLLAYMHAKWVSYQFGIPLVYCDFPYGNELMLEEYEEKAETSFLQQKFFKQRGDIDTFIGSLDSQTLYIIPYFPESSYELSGNSSFSYFKVDWEDVAFKAILRKMIAPKKEMKKPIFPPGRVSVALHVRRGPTFDGGYDCRFNKRSFPLKFPPEHFYIDTVKRLCTVFKPVPLYVHLFTDDINPLSLLNRFKIEFRDYDILWNCREADNHWSANVLEDFFALIEFDCAVHSESNLALCAGKIAHYQIEIMPETFHWEKRTLFIDSVVVHGENSIIVAKYKSLSE